MVPGAPNRGVGGSQPPLNFGLGGGTPVNPPDFEKKILGGGGVDSP